MASIRFILAALHGHGRVTLRILGGRAQNRCICNQRVPAQSFAEVIVTATPPLRVHPERAEQLSRR